MLSTLPNGLPKKKSFCVQMCVVVMRSLVFELKATVSVEVPFINISVMFKTAMLVSRSLFAQENLTSINSVSHEW